VSSPPATWCGATSKAEGINVAFLRMSLATRLALTVGLAIVANWARQVQAQSPYVIALDVVDRAGTSAEAITQAEHTVARILGSAGMSLRWREHATGAGGGTSVAVTLLPVTTVRRMAEFRSEQVLAFAAPPPLRRIWIYGKRVRYSAADYGTSEGALLGHVIAHETLHTLGLGHSPRGLMRSSARVSGGMLDQRLTTSEVATVLDALTSEQRAHEYREAFSASSALR
jgi:hypothetical protein